jgi:hypothetical protein
MSDGHNGYKQTIKLLLCKMSEALKNAFECRQVLLVIDKAAKEYRRQLLASEAVQTLKIQRKVLFIYS